MQTTALLPVTILLSTYNGERFLSAQLNSLYAQDYPNIKILVRDDGSSDGTWAILAQAQQQGKLQIVHSGNNLGPAQSFFKLLKEAAATETGFVAFCDQDDVWSPEKVRLAVASLAAHPAHIPALYCSSLEMVDSELRHLGAIVSFARPGFGNALVENIAVGCTIVLNRPAIDLVVKSLPVQAYMHDWWCYLVISCFGEIIFDSRTPIKYRQHGNNSVGAPINVWAGLQRKWHRFTKGRRWISEHADIFWQKYNEQLSEEQRYLLTLIKQLPYSFRSRLALALSKNIWRQRWQDNVILRALILLNRI